MLTVAASHPPSLASNVDGNDNYRPSIYLTNRPTGNQFIVFLYLPFFILWLHINVYHFWIVMLNKLHTICQNFAVKMSNGIAKLDSTKFWKSLTFIYSFEPTTRRLMISHLKLTVRYCDQIQYVKYDHKKQDPTIFRRSFNWKSDFLHFSSCRNYTLF